MTSMPTDHHMPAAHTIDPHTDRSPTEPPPSVAAFDHGPVGRFNAWFFTTFDRYLNHITRTHKTAAFGTIESLEVVELGVGVGANLRYLPPGTRLTAIEPNLQMHDRLRRRASAAGIDLRLSATSAASLNLPDSSVDEVICSLVLCTVDDPAAVVAEVRRVLRPGGRFRFVEHVAAPRWSPRRWLQRAIRRPWAWLYEGCMLDRDTSAVVEAAGFRHLVVHHQRLRNSAFIPVNSAIWGVAIR